MIVMRPDHEADRRTLPSAEVKNKWTNTSTPLYVIMACMRMILIMCSLHTCRVGEVGTPDPCPDFSN